MPREHNDSSRAKFRWGIRAPHYPCGGHTLAHRVLLLLYYYYIIIIIIIGWWEARSFSPPTPWTGEVSCRRGRTPGDTLTLIPWERWPGSINPSTTLDTHTWHARKQCWRNVSNDGTKVVFWIWRVSPPTWKNPRKTANYVCQPIDVNAF